MIDKPVADSIRKSMDPVVAIGKSNMDYLRGVAAGGGRYSERFVLDDLTERVGGLMKDDGGREVTKKDIVDTLAFHSVNRRLWRRLFGPFVSDNFLFRFLEWATTIPIFQCDGFNEEKMRAACRPLMAALGRVDLEKDRQEAIAIIYQRIFKDAFPKETEKFGVVYTPTEIVDFILQSCDEILKKEFGSSLSDQNAKVVDPFSGTGIFTARLFEKDGLLDDVAVGDKYKEGCAAFEITLVGYYIGILNIESAYHKRKGAQ